MAQSSRRVFIAFFLLLIGALAVVLVAVARPRQLTAGVLGQATPGAESQNHAGTPHPTPPSYDLAAVTQLVEDAVESTPLDGAVLLLTQDGQTIYEHAFGTYTVDTAVPIASGSKWLTAATIMTLVDDGLLSLDAPIAHYLPGLAGDVGQVTLRQLLSHTSGLPDYAPSLDDPSITLAERVDQILQAGLDEPPGTEFDYGSVSFQVAGRIAEVVSGQPWAELFEARIKGPLAMWSTTYGSSLNPMLAGDVVSSARDYSRFLQMLLDQGTYHGRRVLSAASIAEMQRDQTHGVPLIVTMHEDGRRYGLGEWRDAVDAQGNAVQLSSQGDTGFSPWIDLQRHVAGVFLVDDFLGNVYGLVDEIQARTRGGG